MLNCGMCAIDWLCDHGIVLCFVSKLIDCVNIMVGAVDMINIVKIDGAFGNGRLYQ